MAKYISLESSEFKDSRNGRFLGSIDKSLDTRLSKIAPAVQSPWILEKTFLFRNFIKCKDGLGLRLRALDSQTLQVR